jgi:hypothetical protein
MQTHHAQHHANLSLHVQELEPLAAAYDDAGEFLATLAIVATGLLFVAIT